MSDIKLLIKVLHIVHFLLFSLLDKHIRENTNCNRTLSVTEYTDLLICFSVLSLTYEYDNLKKDCMNAVISL
jgi:hypothetical protein